eukprot:TRINITY_DN73219_c0_g1_i1.p1 TRINITY_DN73219_c0_g1~~TRINITY_DN73219_c0_g1_i1.p1  ORF type:complete len:942 (-),score=162.45 TRINITY_DN73219_c0_g1_i1:185-2986(-)
MASPTFVYEGRWFTGAIIDFEDLGPQHGDVILGGDLSIAFTARWDSFQRWSRIIDFGDGQGKANIFIGNRGNSGTLAFHIWVGDREYSLHAHDAITISTTRRYLCTVSCKGHMRIYVDGQLRSETTDGAAPACVPRRKLYVGKSHWERDAMFHGIIADLAVWNALLGGDESEAASSPEVDAPTTTWDESLGEPLDEFEFWRWQQQQQRQTQTQDETFSPAPEMTGQGGDADAEGARTLQPALMYRGREFSGNRADFEDLAVNYGPLQVGGALSIAFTARWDTLRKWSHIIDFGNGQDDGNVFIGNKGTTQTLAFHVLANGQEHRLHVPNAIVPGETHRYLCTVSVGGHMRVFQDGFLLGELHRGAAPPPGPRRLLFIAKSNWDRDDPFHGLLEELLVWNDLVEWDDSEVSDPSLFPILEPSFVASQAPANPEPEAAGAFATVPSSGKKKKGSVSAQPAGAAADAPPADEPVPEGAPSIMRFGRAVLMPAKYFETGIVAADGPPGLPGHFYRCSLCGAGPFNALEVIEAHVKSKRHQQKAGTGPAHTTSLTTALWNMPSYVIEEPDGLCCTLCNSRASVVNQMYAHLGGDRHARRCRADCKEEIVYSSERRRLEVRSTGKAVIRPGFEDAAPADETTPTTQVKHSARVESQAPSEALTRSDAAVGVSLRSEVETRSSLAPARVSFVPPSAGSRTAVAAAVPVSSQVLSSAPTTAQASSLPAVAAGESRSAPSPPPARVVNPEPVTSIAHTLEMKPPFRAVPGAEASEEEAWAARAAEHEAVGEEQPQLTASDHSVADAATPSTPSSTASTALANESSESAESRLLPPGWRAVWDAGAAAYYYADMESNVAQWEPPPPYVHGDWERFVDRRAQRVFWASRLTGLYFYEDAAMEAGSRWRRWRDAKGRAYWSCSDAGIRFFERVGKAPADIRSGGA